MNKLFAALGVVAALMGAPAWAADQTVALSVSGMTCATCPIAVKTALKRVDGVKNAVVTFENKQAVVTFDDSKTNAQALMSATAQAGFPSTQKLAGATPLQNSATPQSPGLTSLLNK